MEVNKVLTALLLAAFLSCAAFGLSPVASTNINAVWAFGDTETVKQSDLSNPLKAGNDVWQSDTVVLAGAKNEIVAFQLVLQAGSSSASSVNVSLDSLSYGSNLIKNDPASQGDPYNYVGKRIEFFVEDYTNVGLFPKGCTYWDNAQPKDIHGQDYTGRWPDALVPFEAGTAKGGAPFSIAASTNQPVWIDIYLPKTTPSGTYTGTMQVKEGGTVKYNVPIRLTVYDFTLPDETHFKNMFWGAGDDPVEGLTDKHPESYGSADYNTVELRYFQMAHRHRMDLTFNAGLPGTSSMDINHYKGFLAGTYYTSAYNYGGPETGIGHGTYSINTYASHPTGYGYMGTTQSSWATAAQNWVDWFNQNSPNTDYFVYMQDEAPSSDYPDIAQKASWIPKNTSGRHILRTYDTAPMAPELVGSIDFWSVTCQAGYSEGGPTGGFDLNRVPARQAAGDRVAIYNSVLPDFGSVMVTPPADQRIIPWIGWKYKVDQYFDWDSFYWGTGTNIFEDTGTGWNVEGNGFIFYPGEQKNVAGTADDKGLKGPVASIRMKAWRRGQQDYEYLWLARQAGKDTTSIVNAVVPHAFNDFGGSYTSHNQQPDWAQREITFETARVQIAALLAGTVTSSTSTTSSTTTTGRSSTTTTSSSTTSRSTTSTSASSTTSRSTTTSTSTSMSSTTTVSSTTSTTLSGQNLVLRLAFDEGSGTTAYDGSGLGNDGTLTGGAAWVDGQSGQAVGLDGIDDYVQVKDSSTLALSDAITIAAWIKPATSQEHCWDGTTGNYGVMASTDDHADSNYWSWQLRYGAPTTCYLGFQFHTTPANTWVTVGQNLNAGQWYHVAATYDGSQVKSYLNGQLKEDKTMSVIVADAKGLFVGVDGWSDYFNGSVDDVRIYHRSLAASEILQLYAATTTTTTTPSSSTTTLKVPGDADGDGHVDYSDLIILASSYGEQSGQAGFDGRADFNSDGVVDYDDLIVLALNYGG